MMIYAMLEIQHPVEFHLGKLGETSTLGCRLPVENFSGFGTRIWKSSSISFGIRRATFQATSKRRDRHGQGVGTNKDKPPSKGYNLW